MTTAPTFAPTTTTAAGPHAGAPHAPARGGFTLVELMVSIALVLLLILGVNQVFKLTSDTIGASNGLSDAVRVGRAVQGSMFDDLKKAVLPGEGLSRGGPFLLIHSERISAFPNADAELGDRDYLRSDTPATADDHIRTVDADGDNTESFGESPERIALSDRNHRTDYISFFARDVYRRQTGNDAGVPAGSPGVYAADMSASEAWVWYGHIKQPNAKMLMTQSMSPGYTPSLGSASETAETNPNNFYARQWHLGRVATLLVEPTPEQSGRVIRRVDAHGVPREEQAYIPRTAGVMTPFSQGTQATVNGSASLPERIQDSRYDLAGTSIAGYESILKALIIADPTVTWWDGSGVGYRFSGFPYPTKPMSPFGAARTVPCFVPACTQFVVEFAGDFITQERKDYNEDGYIDDADRANADYGQGLFAKPDGILDFIVDRDGPKPIERVRWYGFPRNVYTGDDKPDGSATVVNGGSGRAETGSVNELKDVVPVRDVLVVCKNGPPPVQVFIPAPFERTLPTMKADYGGTGSNVAATADYTCAWGPSGSYLITNPSPPPAATPIDDPNLPRMIRFVVGVDDPDGRMTNTQLYEYVVEVP
jgi:prepilin-type N-terminal cleavage/methylation domain-containing protein